MVLEGGKFKSMAAASAQHLVRAFLLHHSIIEDIMGETEQVCQLGSLSL